MYLNKNKNYLSLNFCFSKSAYFFYFFGLNKKFYKTFGHVTNITYYKPFNRFCVSLNVNLKGGIYSFLSRYYDLSSFNGDILKKISKYNFYLFFLGPDNLNFLSSLDLFFYSSRSYFLNFFSTFRSYFFSKIYISLFFFDYFTLIKNFSVNIFNKLFFKEELKTYKTLESLHLAYIKDFFFVLNLAGSDKLRLNYYFYFLIFNTSKFSIFLNISNRLSLVTKIFLKNLVFFNINLKNLVQFTLSLYYYYLAYFLYVLQSYLDSFLIEVLGFNQFSNLFLNNNILYDFKILLFKNYNLLYNTKLNLFSYKIFLDNRFNNTSPYLTNINLIKRRQFRPRLPNLLFRFLQAKYTDNKDLLMDTVKSLARKRAFLNRNFTKAKFSSNYFFHIIGPVNVSFNHFKNDRKLTVLGLSSNNVEFESYLRTKSSFRFIFFKRFNFNFVNFLSLLTLFVYNFTFFFDKGYVYLKEFSLDQVIFFSIFNFYKDMKHYNGISSNSNLIYKRLNNLRGLYTNYKNNVILQNNYIKYLGEAKSFKRLFNIFNFYNKKFNVEKDKSNFEIKPLNTANDSVRLKIFMKYNKLFFFKLIKLISKRDDFLINKRYYLSDKLLDVLSSKGAFKVKGNKLLINLFALDYLLNKNFSNTSLILKESFFNVSIKFDNNIVRLNDNTYKKIFNKVVRLYKVFNHYKDFSGVFFLRRLVSNISKNNKLDPKVKFETPKSLRSKVIYQRKRNVYKKILISNKKNEKYNNSLLLLSKNNNIKPTFFFMNIFKNKKNKINFSKKRFFDDGFTVPFKKKGVYFKYNNSGLRFLNSSNENLLNSLKNIHLYSKRVYNFVNLFKLDRSHGVKFLNLRFKENFSNRNIFSSINLKTPNLHTLKPMNNLNVIYFKPKFNFKFHIQNTMGEYSLFLKRFYTYNFNRQISLELDKITNFTNFLNNYAVFKTSSFFFDNFHIFGRVSTAGLNYTGGLSYKAKKVNNFFSKKKPSPFFPVKKFNFFTNKRYRKRVNLKSLRYKNYKRRQKRFDMPGITENKFFTFNDWKQSNFWLDFKNKNYDFYFIRGKFLKVFNYVWNKKGKNLDSFVSNFYIFRTHLAFMYFTSMIKKHEKYNKFVINKLSKYNDYYFTKHSPISKQFYNSLDGSGSLFTRITTLYKFFNYKKGSVLNNYVSYFRLAGNSYYRISRTRNFKPFNYTKTSLKFYRQLKYGRVINFELLKNNYNILNYYKKLELDYSDYYKKYMPNTNTLLNKFKIWKGVSTSSNNLFLLSRGTFLYNKPKLLENFNLYKKVKDVIFPETEFDWNLKSIFLLPYEKTRYIKINRYKFTNYKVGFFRRFKLFGERLVDFNNISNFLFCNNLNINSNRFNKIRDNSYLSYFRLLRVKTDLTKKLFSYSFRTGFNYKFTSLNNLYLNYKDDVKYGFALKKKRVFSTYKELLIGKSNSRNLTYKFFKVNKIFALNTISEKKLDVLLFDFLKNRGSLYYLGYYYIFDFFFLWLVIFYKKISFFLLNKFYLFFYLNLYKILKTNSLIGNNSVLFEDDFNNDFFFNLDKFCFDESKVENFIINCKNLNFNTYNYLGVRSEKNSFVLSPFLRVGLLKANFGVWSRNYFSYSFSNYYVYNVRIKRKFIFDTNRTKKE